jgi:hypothetical protein
VAPDSKQIQISASSRGIVDYFFCFVCDEYRWECDHLIEDRLVAPLAPALEGSKLHSFAYDGRQRVLEIEFRVGPPYTPGNEVLLPPQPRVIHYFNVTRYVFTAVTRCKTARALERYWEDTIRRRFRGQTVRTVCRLPRIRRFAEARLTRYTFGDYLLLLSTEEQQSLTMAVMAMKALLIRTLAPQRVAGLGGLLECQSWEESDRSRRIFATGTVFGPRCNVQRRECEPDSSKMFAGPRTS